MAEMTLAIVGIPEWIGSWIFLIAVALTGAKLNRDFGKRGELAYMMFFLFIGLYAGAVGLAYGYL